MVAGLISSLVGGAASTGLGFLGQYLNVGYQKQLQEHAGATNYKYAEKTARNQPTWNRAGLVKAGYNPMLAVQNATSGANAGWTSTGQASPSDLAGDYSTGVANAQSFQRLRNETNIAEAQQDQAYATADELKSRNAINVSKLPYVSHREKAEIANTEAQSAKLENDIHFQNEMINYYKNSLKLQEMGLQPQIINAGANASNAKTNRLQYQIDKEVNDIIRDKEKRYKDWGNKHPHLRNIDETITRYFNGFGASASKSSVSKR